MDEETDRSKDPAAPDAAAEETAGDAPAETAAPAPVVASDPARTDKVGGGARVLAVVAALILALLAAVAVVASAEISDLTPCEDVTSPSQLSDTGECYDGSETEKIVSLAFAWPGAALACLAVLFTLGIAVRGRGTGLAIKTTIAAAVLFGLGILIGSL